GSTGIGAKSGRIPTRQSRELDQRCCLEYRDVAVILDILSQHLIAGRRPTSSVVSKTVGRPDKQVMSARRDSRTVRNYSDENRIRIAVSAHLEQAITVRRVVDSRAIINDMRLVRVVINLDEVIPCTGWPTRSQFADQDCSWLSNDQDRASGRPINDSGVHWTRQQNLELFVAFIHLGV